MQRALIWFHSLSIREQVLVGIAAALLIVLVGVYGIINPLMNGVNEARRSHAEAAEREGRIMGKIDQLDAPAVSVEREAIGALDLFVRQEASEMGIVVDDVRATGDDGVSFTIGQVTAPALFGWLVSLEKRGLIVNELDARPVAGSALSARISLRRP